MKYSWIFRLFCLFLVKWVYGGLNNASLDPSVDLTLINSAISKGAVCLDGTPPGYHLQRGHGSGKHNWLVDLEGGGWCNSRKACVFRSSSALGSSTYMQNQTVFSGMLTNIPQQNPDFHNWNRVRVRYCDGASFAGEGYDKNSGLYFRGQRIWSAVMEELMSKGMHSAKKALLSGCSAGGLASILHCDQFRSLFPEKTKVKCLADAGLFLDAVDIAGQRTLRSYYEGVVSLQGVAKNLPKSCTSRMNASLCFFPQNLVNDIKTPIFLLNAAYDAWQIQESLAPISEDPNGHWKQCKLNYTKCDRAQIRFLQGFRDQMKRIVENFSKSKETNGLFIDSCFTHCQSLFEDTWYGNKPPTIANKGIGKSVGDWYFERAQVKAIDCPYPCDKTCHNLVFSTLLDRLELF